MDYKWVHSSAFSSIPEDAVVGGNDVDGAMMYVGRSYHNGDQLVAKVIPSKQIAFVSWGGEEIPKIHFEVLCGRNVAWVHCYDHVIPENAVLCGRTSLEQPIYIGRGYHEGSLTVGKISSVHRALFIPFQGSERRLETYEILIAGREEKHWLTASTDPLPPPPPSMLSYEKPYPYPEDKKPGLYPTAPSPMPMPMPMPMPTPTPNEPPPSYAASTMPVPAQTYTPANPGSGFTPAATAGPSYTPAAVAPPYPPESNASVQIVSPAEVYPTKPSYVQVMPSIPAKPYTPANSYVPAATYVPPTGAYPTAPTTPDMWVAVSPSYTPPNAVHAGHDADLSTIFVCRAFHDGGLIPGKALPNRGCAYIPYNGMELVKTHYEVLLGNEKYMWVHARGGDIAPGAVEAGRTPSGEPLYVGRTHHAGTLTPGKIHRSHHCLYISFGGTEHRISHAYEVLVRRDDYYRNQGASMLY